MVALSQGCELDPLRDRIPACEMGGKLQTYFTAGPKEVRAWTVRRGSTAPQAAGVIHTDFEHGFIRAEVIAFADYIAVPERNLHVVPDDMPDDVAVFTEPVAAVFQIPAQMTINRYDRIVVLGDGRLGNLCGQVLAHLSKDVTVIGKHEEKLKLLQDLGVRTALLSEFPARRDVDIVVDCTGSPTGLPAALKLVTPRGTVVLKTTVAGEQTLALAPVVIDEVTILGSRCGPFDRALTALDNGEVSVLSMISARYSLDKGVDALEHARSRPSLKVLIDVES